MTIVQCTIRMAAMREPFAQASQERSSAKLFPNLRMYF